MIKKKTCAAAHRQGRARRAFPPPCAPRRDRRCHGARRISGKLFFFKQKTAYEIGLGIPAEPLFRSLLLSLLLPSLLIMFIPSTFKRPVSSWKALNLRKTLLMASSVRLKPLNCSRLPCVYAQETLTFLLTQKKTCVKNYVQKE